jgi:hypothetical protein
MIPELFHTFRHEVVSTVLVSVFIGAAMYPFKKIKSVYYEFTTKLDNINKELTTQSNNHLVHIENSNEKQLEVLGKVAETLNGVRLDLAEQTGLLRAGVPTVARKRKTR